MDYTTLFAVFDKSRNVAYWTEKLLLDVNPQTYRVLGEVSQIAFLDPEDIWYKLAKIPRKALLTFDHIYHNLQYRDNLAYSFIDEQFQIAADLSDKEIQEGCTLFLQFIARQLDGVDCAFLVRPNSQEGEFGVSFRSKKNTINVAELAEKLGGGGHINAASGRVKAKNVKAAVRIVLGAAEN